MLMMTAAAMGAARGRALAPRVAVQTYSAWMAKVNSAVFARVGCSVYDLPDCCFMDWYQSGMSAAKAAAKAVASAKEGM